MWTQLFVFENGGKKILFYNAGLDWRYKTVRS